MLDKVRQMDMVLKDSWPTDWQNVIAIVQFGILYKKFLVYAMKIENKTIDCFQPDFSQIWEDRIGKCNVWFSSNQNND